VRGREAREVDYLDESQEVNPAAKAGVAGGPASGEEGVAISIIVSEVEAVGGFVGSSFSEPVLNAGILLSVFGYMLYTQPLLALVAIVLFCPQFLFIPLLQGASNKRTASRIQIRRAMSVDIVNEAAERKQIYSRIPRGEYRPVQAADIWKHVADNLSRPTSKAAGLEFLRSATQIHRGGIAAFPKTLEPAERREQAGEARMTLRHRMERIRGEFAPAVQRTMEMVRRGPRRAR